jgi:hypothetical protein
VEDPSFVRTTLHENSRAIPTLCALSFRFSSDASWTAVRISELEYFIKSGATFIL